MPRQTHVGDELITTGEAASMLGCSRQHVVDLCDSGRLSFVRIGRHRRVDLGDIRRMVAGSDPSRDELQSLWLHRAIAGELVRDPGWVLVRARANAARLLSQDPPPGAERTLRRWLELMDAGPEAVLRMLTSTTAEATELRQGSPFLGILSEGERQSVLRAFGEAWAARRR